MTESERTGGGERESWGTALWKPLGVVAAMCAVVIGVYIYTAHSGYLVSTSLNAADGYYNLLVQGFQAGQLSLKKEVPPGLAALADPYDPGAHFPYRVLDLSYYRGKLYLYFGATPVLVLFWPYAALTGQYLLQKNAAVLFCAVGFLVSTGLLWALWRRYFAEVSVWAVVAGTLALGLGTCTPLLLARCDVHEVSISCGYALTMLALAGIWKALHEPGRRGWWLAAASLAYGLAVGTRPSLLLGAVILLVPVVQTRRERGKVWAALLAATGPIVVIGLGLMLYNALRFDNPLEFGWRYQMAGDRQDTVQHFSLRYLWFNFRVYFLELARWSSRFPFVHDIAVPPLPAGHGHVEHPFGVLTNIPLVWLVLAAPLAWRARSAEAQALLRRFLGAVTALFAISAVTLGLFFAACARYEVEFLAPLVLLAAVGYLSLERALAAPSGSKPALRLAVRWSAGVLLALSIAFNLLACVERCAEAHYDFGNVLAEAGRTTEAVAHYERALRLHPDFAEVHNNLGSILGRTGRNEEAISHYEQALRINPDFPEVHYCLAVALEKEGRVQEALGHYERAVSIKPDLSEAQNNMGNALLAAGQATEAIHHYEQALRVRPDSAETHLNYGNALCELGRTPEAITHYEQALRLKPNFMEAHYSLGTALLEMSRPEEAGEQYEQALRINPDFSEAHYNLGNVLFRQGQVPEAITHYEQALRLKPNYPEAHNNLGTALLQAGKTKEAIDHYEQALRLKPDYMEAHYNLGVALARAGHLPEAMEHWEQALQINPDYSEAHFNLGAALEHSGRVAEARQHYEQALRINPGFAEAQNRLSRLRTTQ